MSDYGVAHCIATKQYWVATWKVIDSRLPLLERKPLKEVDDIVYLAIRDQLREELGKIMRDFSAYVGDEASMTAHGFLNETTEIDLRPDEL
jgi:hypothetical protein